jgi:hypothetical protein
MPSPFPGMNPYLEQPDIWNTFHTQSLTAIAERLADQVRPEYVVHMEAHLWIHERVEEDLEGVGSKRRLIGRGDVAVFDRGPGLERHTPRSEAGGSMLAAPARSSPLRRESRSRSSTSSDSGTWRSATDGTGH